MRIIYQTPLDYYEVSSQKATLEEAQAEAKAGADQGLWITPTTYIPPQAIRVAYIKDAPK